MATPKSIKNVAASFVKNTLSPRNPQFLEVPSPKFFYTPQKPTRWFSLFVHIKFTSISFYSNFSSPISRKRLNFTSSCNSNVFATKNHFFRESDVSKKTYKRSIIIDTPTKTDLMKNGLSNRERVVDILGKGTFGTVVKGFYKSEFWIYKNWYFFIIENFVYDFLVSFSIYFPQMN